MATKKTNRSAPLRPARPVYDPAIREAIARGELAEMRRLLKRAKALLGTQGDLGGAITRLERAIAKVES